ncbi:MAG: aminoglycoside phosphotransferase family protein [Myxococcota bacterium]
MKEKEISGGRINKVAAQKSSISKTYQEGGIVKGLGLSARQRWENEAVALSTYSDVYFEPLRVPKIISTDEQTLTTVMERIHARPIEDIVSRDASFLTKERAVKLARVLEQIHALKQETNPGLYKKYLATFHVYVQNASEILRRANIDPDRPKAWMAGALSGLKAHAEVVPVHTDFWFENILADDADNFYVIDWEFYSTGSPYENLGVFYMNVNEHFSESRDFCDTFFRAYDPGVDVELVRAFCVYRCLRLLSHVDVEDYEREPLERPHSFKELANIVRENISR